MYNFYARKLRMSDVSLVDGLQLASVCRISVCSPITELTAWTYQFLNLSVNFRSIYGPDRQRVDSYGRSLHEVRSYVTSYSKFGELPFAGI